MAHLVDDAVVEIGGNITVGIPISKMEEQSDGSVIIHGLCTSDTVDLDDQIIDLDFSRKGLTAWASSFGNIRQMHSTNLPPAGKAIQIDTSRPEGVYLTARIVEPGAVKLCKEGVYSAFSVGISKPRIVRDKVAKQGRVLDGVFSEVSVVDFPALPTAKFNIVKRSKTEVNKIEKTLTPIGTLVKSATEKKGLESVTDKNDETVEKKDSTACEICKGAGCEKCMGKNAEAEVEKKKLPDVDEEVTEDLDDAANAIDDAQDAQAEDNAAHMSDDDDDDDDDVKKSIDGISYALRRAHDVLCDAFSPTAIASAHPSVSKGYSTILDPEVIRNSLAIVAKNATPSELASLASAVGAAQSLALFSDSDIASMQAEVHKAFSDAYPTAHPTPGSVTPGMFARPFIVAGRAPLSSTGAHARIPVANSTIEGDDFSRGPLTAGRQGTSPANAGNPPSSTVSAAEQIASASRDHAIASLTALHDHISSAYPDICPLGSEGGFATHAGFSGAGVDNIDMGGRMQAIAAGATPSLTKKEKKVLKQAKQLVKMSKLAAFDSAESGIVKAVANKDGDVLIDTDALNTVVKSLVEEYTRERFDALDDVLSIVQSEVEKLGSEPDPAKAPVRGTVVLERAVEKAATQADILRRSAEDSLTEQVKYLRSLTKSGNPELRMRAEAQLTSLLERSAFESGDE